MGLPTGNSLPMKRINVKHGARVIFRPLRPVGEPWIGDNETGGWLRAGSAGTVTAVREARALVAWASDGTTFYSYIDAEDEGTGWMIAKGEAPR